MIAQTQTIGAAPAAVAVTVREAAERLGVGYKTCLALIWAGRLRAVDVAPCDGRTIWRISEQALADFLNGGGELV